MSKHLIYLLLAAAVAAQAAEDDSYLLLDDPSPRLSAEVLPELPGVPVYAPAECVGAVVNGVCHGAVLPESAAPVRCHGQMVAGQCTGPLF